MKMLLIKKLTPSIYKAVIVLFIIGIIPFGVIIIFGPNIFSFIFGSEWKVAGEYARWISVVSLAMLITRPIIVVIPILGIQRQFLIIEILGTIAKIGSLFYAVKYHGVALYAVILFSLASVAMYFILIYNNNC